MRIFRSIMGSLVIVALVVLVGRADLITWVDDQGVRHFSNTQGPPENKKINQMDEFKDNHSEYKRPSSGRDRFKVLDMYEEDQKQARIKEEAYRQKKAAELKKQKAENKCAEARKKLEALKLKGWQDLNGPSIEAAVPKEDIWFDVNGQEHNNIVQRNIARNRARKAAYERAIKMEENKVSWACRP